jgi:hypothetical protein
MIEEIIYLPDGLIHMKLIYSEDMELIDYILYGYDNNQIKYEYKSNGDCFYYSNFGKHIIISDEMMSNLKEMWAKILS